MDTSREVGAAILQRFAHLHARMKEPDVRVQIDIRDHAYVSTETIPGPGGLPVGTGGKALALVSGGIDSPVAAWLGARRGLTVIPVHFHSFPFTSERSKEKVLDLCRVLAEYTGPLRVWIVFFTEIQRAVQLTVPDALRIVVMRRMMLRLADQIAGQEHAQALLTGESLGQVTSQTIESIGSIIGGWKSARNTNRRLGWDTGEDLCLPGARQLHPLEWWHSPRLREPGPGTQTGGGRRDDRPQRCVRPPAPPLHRPVLAVPRGTAQRAAPGPDQQPRHGRRFCQLLPDERSDRPLSGPLPAVLLCQS